VSDGCTQCGGPLPRHPAYGLFQENGKEARVEFCNWRCAVLWRAAQGDPEAEQIAEKLFGVE
jgi:hypothetical protein